MKIKAIILSPCSLGLLFFFSGLIFAAVCVGIDYYWINIVPYRSSDAQPTWLHALRRLVGWLPWLVCAAVVALRFLKGRSFHAVAYLLGTITTFFLIVAYLVLPGNWDNYLHRQKFDSELWRNQPNTEYDEHWPPRLCMVDDLVSSGILSGRTESEVVELLGLPCDKTFPLGPVACEIVYYLGPAHGFCAIDSEWLYISFGRDGKVDRYWVRLD